MGTAVDFDTARNQNQKIMIDIHNMQLQATTFNKIHLKKKTSCLAKRLTTYVLYKSRIYICMHVRFPSSFRQQLPPRGRWPVAAVLGVV